MRILGVSAPYHDGSACLIEDGELVCAVEEERLIRSKRAWNKFPVQAAKWCLESRGLQLSDIDRIAYPWERNAIQDQSLSKYNVSPRALFPTELFGSSPRSDQIIDVNHHLSHAASTFRFSGFPSAAIMVIDGTGEDVGTSIYHGQADGQIKLLRSWKNNWSLGHFYEGATQYVGFSKLEAGKLMGLAPYGEGELLPYIRLTDDGIEMDVPSLPTHEHVTQYWVQQFMKDFGPANKRIYHYDIPSCYAMENTPFDERIKNFAASVQLTLDHAIIHLAKLAKEWTGEEYLCLAGGVALNCTTNGKILRQKLYSDIFVPGPANDTGGSIGAAAELWFQETGRSLKPMDDLGLGPKFTPDQVGSLLKKLGVRYTSVNSIERAARLIGEGKIGAWFSGGIEIGPRALGHRSIIANPAIGSHKDRLNIEVKKRETWRPYGPSMLQEYAEPVFGEALKLPYMLFTLPVVGDKDNLPAVTHVDGTTRVQTVVNRPDDPYAYLLTNVRDNLGFPAVVNTSFNIGGEPVVCRPEEAVRSFFSSPLDFLYIEGHLLWKEN
ncbi:MULTISPECIES: carbamoyltransferase family protein [Paenibacillus]|uniref:carbamoyltransferase family protein n=1 Tax=Paenibacillus TaxID=44249 RepID=UPI00096C8E5B|nr:carbamoyltransferase C-terminal domain-containing protein [Paenibacillus borealis]